MNYKIREAQVQKVPYMLVVGDKESGGRSTVSVRHRHAGDLGSMTAVDGRRRRSRGSPPSARRARRPLGRPRWRCLIDQRTVRINDRIRAKEVRVIDDDGSQLGIMPPAQALSIAEEKGLDLVEIAATATPPVCRIMNSGKFFYQQAKRESEARKHQRHIQVKEVKFRPKIDEHDFQFKKRNVERFLNDGNKVKSTVIFRGREMVHNEIGRRILNRLAAELTEIALIEVPPRQEGMTMVQILSPKKEHVPAKPAKAAKARRRRRAARRRRGAQGTEGRKKEKKPRTPAVAVAAATARRSHEKAQDEGEAEAQDEPGRGQAVQGDRHRQDQARPFHEAAHPHQEGGGAEAQAAQVDAGVGSRTRRTSDGCCWLRRTTTTNEAPAAAPQPALNIGHVVELPGLRHRLEA